jgi:Tol biopolymer transport system component
MVVPRVEHTATLLPDGKVLVAGGLSGGTAPAVASAELYDPANGTWAATGSMAGARAGFTATLLPDGKVLVAGGYCCTAAGSGALASAELYDPANGTWTATGSMATARTGATATLLRDGRVLVAGGGARGHKGASWASAELYDPGTGSWTATGSMGTPRTWQSATLQPDGKVLVQGGVDSVTAGSHTLTTAELYDPGSGSWTAATGSAVSPVQGESMAVLRDGRALLLCACTSGSARLYDPRSGTWADAGSLITPRWSSTATLLPDGKVLVAGGTNDVGALAAAELYDPGSPGQSPTPSAGPSSSVVRPTGGMVAFISQASGREGQLWVANPDGTGARQLVADLGGSQGAPAWSPDGTRLVFSQAPLDNMGYVDNSAARLYLTDASGSAPQLVDTGCVAPCSGDTDAAFSRDGKRLVFVRTLVYPPTSASIDPVTKKGPGNTVSSVLATVDLSTGRVAMLASTTILEDGGAFQNRQARWSPDGTQIVFTQDVPYDVNGPARQPPPPALLVVDADGRNLHKVSASGSFGDWSPDGTRIVFQSDWYFDIYTIRPDGTGLRRLTSDQSSAKPSWSADGRIRFERQPTVGGLPAGPLRFWIMDADGSNATQFSVSQQLTGTEQSWWGVPDAGLIAWPPQP